MEHTEFDANKSITIITNFIEHPSYYEGYVVILLLEQVDDASRRHPFRLRHEVIHLHLEGNTLSRVLFDFHDQRLDKLSLAFLRKTIPHNNETGLVVIMVSGVTSSASPECWLSLIILHEQGIPNVGNPLIDFVLMAKNVATLCERSRFQHPCLAYVSLSWRPALI